MNVSEAPRVSDRTYGVTETSDEGLADFFKRPVLIDFHSWAIGGVLNSDFDPWSAFFEEPRVANRINNYRMLRGTLCIKFVVNGNPFLFGKSMAAYSPYFENDQDYDKAGSSEATFCRLTQRQHVFLDASSSADAHMRLPFLYHYNAVSIPDKSWNRLGKLLLRSFTTLQHVNGGTDPLSIKVYAWTDDLELSVPTANSISGLLPQSSEEDPKGMISKPAAAIAAVAGKLKNTPVIGPYAKAAQIAASTTADVASAFGYCKPTRVVADEVYIPHGFGNLANATDVDTNVIAALDKKTALSVDPRTIGLDGTDEMAFSTIAAKQSYIGSMTWTTSQTSGDVLCSIGVTPSQKVQATFSGVTGTQLSSTHYLASMFKYWRGTMKFRFMVVASNFHRGRLLVSYDPSGGDPGASNVQYTRIIDITEEKDFTLEIGWGREYPWLLTTGIHTDPVAFVPNSLPIATTGFDYNGTITISVLNQLTEPSELAQTLKVLVFSSGGDDLEFGGLGGQVDMLVSSPYLPVGAAALKEQSADVDQQDPNQDIPEGDDHVESILPREIVGSMQDVFMGDPVTSLRPLLKRYCFTDLTWLNPDELVFAIKTYPIQPLMPGADPEGVHRTGTSAPYNYVNHSYYTWTSMAFVAARGSHRWKIMVRSGATANILPVSAQFLPWQFTNQWNAEYFPLGSTSDSIAYAFSQLWGGSGGATANVYDVNPALELTAPYVSFRRFDLARVFSPLLIGNGWNDKVNAIAVQFTTSSNTYLHRMHAVGDDFMLAGFIGMPILFLMTNPSP
jgi:hypothetical protein